MSRRPWFSAEGTLGDRRVALGMCRSQSSGLKIRVSVARPTRPGTAIGLRPLEKMFRRSASRWHQAKRRLWGGADAPARVVASSGRPRRPQVTVRRSILPPGSDLSDRPRPAWHIEVNGLSTRRAARGARRPERAAQERAVAREVRAGSGPDAATGSLVEGQARGQDHRARQDPIAGLYTLVSTCEARGINPCAYLADVIPASKITRSVGSTSCCPARGRALAPTRSPRR